YSFVIARKKGLPPSGSTMGKSALTIRNTFLAASSIANGSLYATPGKRSWSPSARELDLRKRQAITGPSRANEDDRFSLDLTRHRCEVAILDGHILRERAVAIPVRKAEHPLSNRQPGRPIAESGDYSG